MTTSCPWCGSPPCPGTDPESRVDPCHSLCCMDGSRRACWSPLHPDDRAAIEESKRRERWA